MCEGQRNFNRGPSSASGSARGALPEQTRDAADDQPEYRPQDGGRDAYLKNREPRRRCVDPQTNHKADECTDAAEYNPANDGAPQRERNAGQRAPDGTKLRTRLHHSIVTREAAVLVRSAVTSPQTVRKRSTDCQQLPTRA